MLLMTPSPDRITMYWHDGEGSSAREVPHVRTDGRVSAGSIPARHGPVRHRRRRGHRWVTGALLAAGGGIWMGGGVASASPGRAEPCLVVTELAPGEVAPSTTLPGTCSISAASGTVPEPLAVASTTPVTGTRPHVPDRGRPDRRAAALQLLVRVVGRVLFLTRATA
jgi:hypothetical protein